MESNNTEHYTYDKMVDCLYARRKKGNYSHSIEVNDWILIDVDDEGEILGVELIGIVKRLRPSLLQRIKAWWRAWR